MKQHPHEILLALFLIDEWLIKTGCRVPYLHNQKFYLKCNDKKKIEDGKIETKLHEKLAMPKACLRMSKFRIDLIHMENI